MQIYSNLITHRVTHSLCFNSTPFLEVHMVSGARAFQHEGTKPRGQVEDEEEVRMIWNKTCDFKYSFLIGASNKGRVQGVGVK